MKNNKSCLVLFSGGQDSTTCLYWAKHNFEEVRSLSFDYGQKQFKEIMAVKEISKLSDIENEILEINVLKKISDSALFNMEKDIKKQTHKTAQSLPAAFVPGRNILFLTIAAAYAFKLGIKDIVAGTHDTDSVYPDCWNNTIRSLELTLSLGLDDTIHIHTPLAWLTKKQTVELAYKIEGCFGALKYSHTCYNNEYPPCGKCPACQARQKGFDEADCLDPLLFRKDK